MRKYRKLLIDIAIILAFTVLLMFPYLTKSFLAIEHDTFFHVSRIEQYAKALQHGQILPAIYPYENGGFGYGSPLFYSDIFLLLPAILHNLGLVLVDSYKLTVFLASFFSGITMYMQVSLPRSHRFDCLLSPHIFSATIASQISMCVAHLVKCLRLLGFHLSYLVFMKSLNPIRSIHHLI